MEAEEIAGKAQEELMVLNSTVTVRALGRLRHWISEGFAFTA